MIKWTYEQMDVFTYWVEITDEYGNKLFQESTISSPAFSILKEILTNYLFARKINNSNTIFNYDNLSSEDQMDLKMCCIYKLEDGLDDN